MRSRPSWDLTFYAIANVISERSTCLRAKCGAVIVDPESHTVLSMGYNGAPRGEDHCLDVGCFMEDGHCQRSIHAEVNAVLQASDISRLKGSTIYVVKKNLIEAADVHGEGVCRECHKLLDAAGISVADKALVLFKE